MSVDLVPLLLAGVDEASTRLHRRLDGLTAEEYLWEPVADCWSVRESNGRWVAEPRTRESEKSVPQPVTTIAWRTWHIAADCLAGYVSPSLGDWPLGLPADEWYGEPDAALAALDTATRAFTDRVTALGEDGLAAPLGPSWGSYGEQPWAALVVHAQDEIAHHGAEIALLRDLYLRLG